MKYLALICARAGSKGLPGKNIKPLNGIPLIGRAINVAKKIEKISRIIVSTDSEEISDIALEYGAEVPFKRPKELAQDDSPEWLTWRHAIEFIENSGYTFDAIVVLPVTAPLRNVEDVEACIDLFEKSKVDSVITVTPASRSPYFNMITKDNAGYASLVIPPKYQITRRQDAPEVFDMTTVCYVSDVDFVKRNDDIFKGSVKSVLVPKNRAIDIDEPLDFRIAELILQNELE